ncbi:phosphopantetheine-binding protein [Shewanella sp. JNE10-2]|uniref:type I polyketide synthase n=1 Tax=unclassified Shewanella TaxID=196818 RepID=UPI0020052A6F|nr:MULTISPECIES: type I polyketide synthase [unclassified Shewanella]MCK7628297.1 phosphopantetheine-binding protein [Shewanella sp. JNE9-1]MCK7632596.1 phosphopantetheine-binding protein [Shewanella sp. JNE17]MCK7643546.1 phosphopantetheine-binding protein [Shewanella sp. JNE3-1]MCK7648108.1 phosphopantetheine-binding protein [Shewanella sp. JNE8]MCK7651600.1 phosphopantetheine-binding protein [Shewanella sp. JNE4-1]
MSHTPSVPNSATESKKDKRLNKRLKDMPVAIVGMASIFANSRYLNKFWDLISEKIDAITDIPDTHWRAEDYYDADKSKADKSYCKRGGFLPEVDFNPMEFGLPPNILELTDTSQLLSLIVAKEVLADANLPADYDRDRIGITLGVGGGQKISQSLNSRLQYPVLKKVFKSSGLSDEDSEMLIKKFQDQYIHWEENSFPGSLGNVIAGRIANRFDFGGMNCVVDAACAGSLAAMRMALTELTEGRSDMMITGGVCTDNSPSMYMSFSKTPAFTTNETIQPFDIDSKGMMIGEGIGMVALKRLEDAERDGDRIYAVIKGVGASSDGKFKSIYAPRPEGQAKALERAYDDAGFAPHSIGLVEAHGTGTAAGDVAEFNGLKSVFAQGNDTNQHIALGSVKSQVGHTKSTAGTAGVIKAALALHHKVLPATINVSKPNPKLNIESSPFYLNTETRPWFQRADATPRRAGVSSFGFGGTNFHLVLEEYKPEHSRDEQYRQRSVPQTLLFAAANKAALLSELKAALSQSVNTSANANKSSAASLNAIAQQYPLRVLADTDARLGFVAKDIAQLQAQLNQAISHLESSAHLESGHLETSASEAWQLPSGISYRSHALVAKNESKKVAALFAGQGSQYLNMGCELACHFPEMRQQITASDKVFAHHGQTPLSNILYPIPAFDADAIKAQEAALTNTMFAQSAIGAVSMAQYSLLTQAGFAPDMVAGHSFGELSALCAAGVISNEDYVELAFARGHAMAQVPSDAAASKAADTGTQVDLGTMFAIILKQKNDIDAINRCLAQFDGVKIANYNAPTQLVIAGGTEQTQLAAKAISELGFKAIALPVSGAFHTPLVGHAQKPFAKAIDKAKFSAPSIALYANGTGQLHPSDGKAIKAEFKQHMLQSVRFSEQLQAMYDAGARVFVEFGPKNILQKLVENTLGEHLNELCLVSMNPNPKGDSDSQLRLAAVQLAVAGVALTEVDPYQAVTSQEIAEREAPSAMNIKLTATNHISAATKAKMAKSLATGSVTSQVQYVDRIVETVVEKVVEKEVIVEKVVEKIIEVETNQVATVEMKQKSRSVAQGLSNHQQQATAQLSPSTASVSGDALTAFFSAQSQAAQLHQQFLAIPQQYGDTFTTLMTEQAKMASLGIAIPESLQRSMEMFHQHQAQTLQSHTEFMQLQSSSSQAALAMLNNAPINFTPAVASQPRATAPAPASVDPAPVAATTMPHNAAPVTQAVATEAVSTPVAPVVQTAPVAYSPAVTVQVAPAAPALVMPAVVMPEVTPAAPATSGLSAGLVQASEIESTMMAVVADKTGYPTEMLELGMDMEADLGIDSIKRVEILGTVQDELSGLPELSPEDLAECRTLGEIVDYMQSKLTQNDKLPAVGSIIVAPITTANVATQVATAAPAVNGLSAALVQQTMMAVVADKTGYPTEMLELSMDMEADLGIDSIKRVEILGTVQDELPGLPELSPEDLAECRTLGEIVDYMQSKLTQNDKLPAAGSVVVSTTAQAAPAANGLSAALVHASEIESTMMAVVADKTGYPTEMLELSMDMEADLGIDSIKRVEILGTVQDELPGLPELNPEDLAECRTLGEIVDYMQSKLTQNDKLPAVGSVSATTAAQVTVTATTNNGLSAEKVQQTMMSVVADKTGYPTEMLELSMDMEADLGIDSIKRVEILGTVQDELPGLPELNPEDLAECRTLGEIVALFSKEIGQSKLGQNAVSQNAAPVSAVVQPEPTIDLPPHDLPPHSEVVLKKLPAAAELAQLSPQQSSKQSAQKAVARTFVKDAYIIISDDGHNAGVLAEKLHAQGLTVAVVRSPESLVASASPLNSHIASFTLAAIDDASISVVINEIKTLGQVAGFIHLQPQHKTSADAKGLVLSNAAKASVEQAFLFAKHLQPLLTTAATANTSSSFISVSRIDGGFGYLNHSQIARSELNQAALAGLTKTLSHEWPSVHCRALDIAPALDAKQLANAVIAELFATDNVLEVGVSQGAAQALERVTLVAGKADTRHSAANLTSADKILVTGGAKGVTFECALSLAKRSKAHFILAGRSSQQAIPAWAQGKNNSELKAAAISHIQSLGEKPTPKQVDALVWPVQSSLEIAAALEAFTAVGASAEYLSLDVNNPDAIASTIVPITELSPITGIIHGAGVLADKHIQDKTLDELARVYGTKVTGISNLLAALDLDKLKLIALFSSAAGFYGNTGQSDYAMSNDILNKAALQLAQQLPNAKVMSFDWGPWDGGMVNPALKKMFMDRGVYVIPLKAGAELFASQLLSNTGAQLLVGTDMQGTVPSDEQATQGRNLKKPKADLTTDASDPHALASTLAAIAFTQPLKLQRTLDPKTMIFIEDHCINGNPVLPTVCAIQWMREAAFDVLKQPVKVQSYKLLKGIIFDTAVLQNGVLESEAPITLELELAPLVNAQASVQINALISFEGRPQYQAILVVDDAANDYLATNSKATAFDAQSLAGLSAITTASRLYSDGTLFHGPRLQGIESVVKFDDASLVAKVSLPHVALADCGSFVPNLTPKGSQVFAEDLLLQAMLVWARLKYGAASLPSSIGEFISHAPFAFGDTGYLVLEVVKHSGRAIEANITLYHQDGRLSCQMNNAKVTISKNLNGAFLANKVAANQTAANKAIESVEAKVE